MKFNIINLILILVISIFACNAQITKKVSSRSTIPQGYFSTHISVNYGTADLVLPNTVADVSMACYPPKGLRKREYTDTTKSSQKTKVIPHLNTTTTRTTKVIPNLSTITTKTIKTPPTKTTRSLYPWEQYAEQIRNQPTIQGDYTLYRTFGGMTLCKIYTKPYPTVTKIYFSKEIKTFTTYTTERRYKGISNGITTSLYRTETPYIGYTAKYTYLPVTVTMTSRDQDFSHIYSIDCKSGTRVNTKIPYISTVTYSEPTEVSTITEGRIGKTTTLTFLDVKTDYIKNYSSGTITYSNCSLKNNAKTLPIITTTTTTKIVSNVTTTTTTTTTTKRLPISTTTTTTTTKRLPISTTTTTTTTKRLPISTTTTTTTTKRLPISTTTVTTTTKRLPISECEPVTITVTDKDKVTVTEKETVTVTVGSDDSVQCVKKWGKCGGVGYNGPTCCESGSTCKKLSEYYSQCI